MLTSHRHFYSQWEAFINRRCDVPGVSNSLNGRAALSGLEEVASVLVTWWNVNRNSNSEEGHSDIDVQGVEHSWSNEKSCSKPVLSSWQSAQIGRAHCRFNPFGHGESPNTWSNLHSVCSHGMNRKDDGQRYKNFSKHFQGSD